jgi:uncharacterized protein YbaR (Trm112 family)
MKICPNCKKQYPDNVAVCPDDKTFLDLDAPVSETQATDLTEDATAPPRIAESVDRVGTAAAETFDRDSTTDFGAGRVETVSDRVAATSATTFSQTGDAAAVDYGDAGYSENPMFGWLLPLIIVIILVILGYMFCSK